MCVTYLFLFIFWSISKLALSCKNATCFYLVLFKRNPTFWMPKSFLWQLTVIYMYQDARMLGLKQVCLVRRRIFSPDNEIKHILYGKELIGTEEIISVYNYTICL